MVMVSNLSTIVALSTPPGRSGIGVIRLSGRKSLAIVRTLLRDKNYTPETHKVCLKKLYDPKSGEVLEQALLTFFKSPKSFTGEDTVELSCHGSPVLLIHLVDLLLEAGAIAACPGEFTLRALGNGCLNLNQAEAIQDLIDAQTQSAARQASRQLRGDLSIKLQPLKNELINIITPLESSIEFVEDDLPSLFFEDIKIRTIDLIHTLRALAASFKSGRLLREGLKVVIVGPPNAGKSSLFNSLLLSDSAIVTDIPGTTRDTLVGSLEINGVPIQLVDTAGVRNPTDFIESLGIERTYRAMAEADVILVVFDGSLPFSQENNALFQQLTEQKCLFVLNKSDLPTFCDKEFISLAFSSDPIKISTKTRNGLIELQNALLKPFGVQNNQTDVLITNVRHHDLLIRAIDSLKSAVSLFHINATEDIIVPEFYNALKYLGEITGETTPDDILRQIFSTFCIGK